jgi:hypothetical protein
MNKLWVKYLTGDGRQYFGNYSTQQSSWTRPLVREFQASNESAGVTALRSSNKFQYVIQSSGHVNQFNDNGELLKQWQLPLIQGQLGSETTWQL